MAIFVPGRRNHRGRGVRPAKRSAVAVLQLTAMVDMFTVMAVFLLQNYRVTGETINISKDVVLPSAYSVKELKPANVVVISSKSIMLNNETIAAFDTVKEQEDWMISRLHSRLQALISEGKKRDETLGSKIRDVVEKAQKGDSPTELPEYLKITIQADQNIDFLSVKKVMYTVTEAGVVEINFAVIKEDSEKNPAKGS